MISNTEQIGGQAVKNFGNPRLPATQRPIPFQFTDEEKALFPIGTVIFEKYFHEIDFENGTIYLLPHEGEAVRVDNVVSIFPRNLELLHWHNSGCNFRHLFFYQECCEAMEVIVSYVAFKALDDYLDELVPEFTLDLIKLIFFIAKVIRAWRRELLREGIEANPGPWSLMLFLAFLTFWIDCFISLTEPGYTHVVQHLFTFIVIAGYVYKWPAAKIILKCGYAFLLSFGFFFSFILIHGYLFGTIMMWELPYIIGFAGLCRLIFNGTWLLRNRLSPEYLEKKLDDIIVESKLFPFGKQVLRIMDLMGSLKFYLERKHPLFCELIKANTKNDIFLLFGIYRNLLDDDGFIFKMYFAQEKVDILRDYFKKPKLNYNFQLYDIDGKFALMIFRSLGFVVVREMTVIRDDSWKETSDKKIVDRVLAGLSKNEEFKEFLTNLGLNHFPAPIVIKDTQGWIKDLTKDGDVEANPGPADYNTTIELKERRAQMRRQQYGDKLNNHRIKYQKAFEHLTHKWILTGDLDVDCYKLYELLLRQGFAPNLAPLLPIAVLKWNFEGFALGHGLQHYNKLKRLFYNEDDVKLPEYYGAPEPGEQARRLILKFYYMHYYHHHSTLICLLTDQKYEDQFFGIDTFLSGAGKKVARGFIEEVKPIWDTLVNTLKSYKDSFVLTLKNWTIGMTCLFAAIVGAFGVNYLLKYSSYIFPTGEEEEDEEEVPHEDQAFMFFEKVSKWTTLAWITESGTSLSNFTKAYEGIEWEKKLKSLGNLSSALSNIFTFLEKLKKIVIWVIDSSWKFIFGTKFFETSKQLDEWKDKVNALMKQVLKDNITELNEQRAFVSAYEELVTQMPYVKNIDPALATQLNLAIAKAKEQYRSIHTKIKFTSCRQKPVWIYLAGKPGCGKTCLQWHLPRMIYEHLNCAYPDLWEAIKGPKIFNEQLVYERKGEQEYWDKYNNQWCCVYDDLFQSKEMQPSEGFSLIRAKNDSDYPLHMAAVEDKGVFSFTSKLIISSTNFKEPEFTSFPDLADYRAIKRRRDFVVYPSIMKDDGSDPYTMKALDNMIIHVFKPDPKTGEITLKFDSQGAVCGGGTEYRGIKGLKSFVYEIVSMYAKYSREAGSKSIPITYGFSKNPTPPASASYSDSDSDDSDDNDNFDETRNRKTDHISGGSSSEEGDVFDLFGPEKKTKLKDQCYFGDDLDAIELAPPKEVKTRIITFGCEHYYPSVRVSKSYTSFYKFLFKDTQTRSLSFMATRFKYFSKNVEFIGPHFYNGLYARFGVIVYKDGLRVKEDNWNTILPGNELDPHIAFEFNEKFGTKFESMWFNGYLSLSHPARFIEKNKEALEFLKGKGYMQYETMVNLTKTVYEDISGFVHDRMYKPMIEKFPQGRIDTLKQYLKTAAYLTVGAGIIAGMSKLLMESTNHFGDQSNAKYFERLQRENAKRRMPKIKHPIMKDQFNDDVAHTLVSKVGAQTYAICVTFEPQNSSESPVTVSQFAFGIKADIFCTPAHLFKLGTISYVELFSNRKGRIPYTILGQDLRWKEISDIDMAFFHVPGTQHIKDLTTHLRNKTDVGLEGVEHCCRIDPADTLSPMNKPDSGDVYVPIPITKPIMNFSKSENDVKLSINKGYITKISLATQSGDCGKVYLLFNPKFNKKIAGLHSGGGLHEAIFSPLYMEDVVEFETWLSTKLHPIENQFRILQCGMPIEHPEDPCQFIPEVGEDYLGMEYVGKVTKKFSWPHKTKLLETPVAHTSPVLRNGIVTFEDPPFPKTHAPAVLYAPNKELIDISLRQLHTKKLIIWDEWIEKSHWIGIYNPVVLENTTSKELTLEEALIGAQRIWNDHSISRPTSMAYPDQGKKKADFVLTAQEHFDALSESKKKNFVKVGRTCWVHNKVIWKINKWFELVDSGTIPAHMVLYCLKDEPRPIDRVKAKKTRAFFMGGFVELVITRMLLGEFITKLEENNYWSDVAVGINPYSSQWHNMIKSLERFGEEGLADDASGWDIHFQSLAFARAMTIRHCDYYNIREAKKVRRIYACIYVNVNAFLVIENRVYRAHNMFSGVYLTCICNSIANSVENRIIIKTMKPDKLFDEVCKMKVFGDDIIQVFAKEYIQFFRDNVSTIRHLALVFFGYERTNSFKVSGDNNLVKLNDMLFLQRQSKELGGRIYGALSKESIRVMLQYIMEPKDKTFEAQFAENCAVALMEMSRHGKKDFEELRDLLNGYLAFMGPTYVYNRTWSEALEDMYMRSIQ